MDGKRRVVFFFGVLILISLACSFRGSGAEADPPVVVIVLPAETDTFIVGQLVNVVATVTSDVGIERVDLLVNGVVAASEDVNGGPTDHSLRFEWVPAAEGAVVLAVIAYDTDGNDSEPGMVTIQVATAVSEGSGSQQEQVDTEVPATAEQTVVCTPPPCGANEAYFCPGSCPGGCGITCATFTPTQAPPNTATYTPHPPTATFTPTNTPEWVIPSIQVVVSLQVFNLATVETVYEQDTIPAGSNGSVTAICPADSVLVSGGYAASPNVLIYTQNMTGNGWQVYARNNSGSGELVNSYAHCLKYTNGTTSQVWDSTSVSAGTNDYAEVSCPSGTVVTGGGFASYSNGNLVVYTSYKSGNGWRVYARNNSGSSLQLNSYAVCLVNVTATTSQIYEQDSVAAGGTLGVEAVCPEGDLAVGGGFASQTDFRMYNSTPRWGFTDRWIAYAKNNGGSSNVFNTYAVCLSFD